MTAQPAQDTIAYNSPLHLAFLTKSENMMPIAHWMVISKEAFRFLITMQLGNYSMTLIRRYQEAALHFMPWRDRERVVRTSYMSGDFTNKAERLSFNLLPADKLQHSWIVEAADIVFETFYSKHIT